MIPNSFRLAVLGAGHVGPVIARLAIKAGYPVTIATSGDPDDLALIAELLIPGAGPRWAADAIADADVVVLAIPLHRFAGLSPALTVVKALNHIGYHDLEHQTRTELAPDRRAAGVAGDDPAAVDLIAGFVGRYARKQGASHHDVHPAMAAERGFAIPSKASFDAETGPDGALYVGSPETVARKIAANLRALDATRFDLKYGMPGLTHDQLMTNIELYGQQVIPRVRDLLA